MSEKEQLIYKLKENEATMKMNDVVIKMLKVCLSRAGKNPAIIIIQRQFLI